MINTMTMKNINDRNCQLFQREADVLLELFAELDTSALS